MQSLLFVFDRLPSWGYLDCGKNMNLELPLDRMSTAENLCAIKEIWADLSRHEEQIQSPAWHEQVLRERDERVASGKESYVDWETAKLQLRPRRP